MAAGSRVRGDDGKWRSKCNRKKLEEAYGGKIKPLSVTHLPLWRDETLSLEYETMMEGRSIHETVDSVTKQVIGVYRLASIGTISEKKVKEKVWRIVALKKERIREITENESGKHRVQGKYRRKKESERKTEAETDRAVR